MEKNFAQFRATLRQGVNYLIFINLLAAVLLFTLAEPIIRLLFERGKFDVYSTEHVSFGLVCLVPGLISFSLVNILARAFYALQDIQTPMRISVFCLALNVLLTVFLLFGTGLGAGALGIANSLSSFCNLGLLLFALAEETADPGDERKAPPNCRAWPRPGCWRGWRPGASAGIGPPRRAMPRLPLKLGEVFLPMIATTAVYFLLTLWWKVPAAHEIAEFALARARAVIHNNPAAATGRG